MSNPYQNLDDFCFWSRAMTAPPAGRIDPFVGQDTIQRHHKVATMGSCFAQHLAKHIKVSGLNYYVSEGPPDGMAPGDAERRHYGVFSARYGNVYTVRQALQLFDRAFGSFVARDDVWERQGRWIDAFRPQIEPDGFGSPADVRAASTEHLVRVRDVFTQSDWLVFTLGLTEAWRAKSDGAVYPLAPGVAGGEFDPARYEFVNFTARDVAEDLGLFIERIRGVNPRAKVLLTVSPVPLIATYERRHVWVSTTFSKAALRVAADEAERNFRNVVYFPSYEIITSPAAGGRYYADDLRQVTELGVKHVMRVFSDHFFPQSKTAAGAVANASVATALQKDSAVVCEEEEIERALQRAGLRPG